MKARSVRRAGAFIGGATLAAALLTAPAAVVATPAAAEDTGTGCEVTGGTLTWGFKESFRSYISGSIANGSWEASDGADYEIPNFVWSDATGTIDPETGSGEVSFTGTVHFTGHDGVLDLTIANPTIEFDEGEAALLLDARSTDMEGDEATNVEQEWFGDITVDGAIQPSDDAIELTELPITLTNSGASSFAGFYEAGADLDPITLNLEVAGCESTAAPVEEDTPAPTEEPVAAAQEQQNIPWLPIGIGGAALFVIGLTVGLLIGGRKPKTAQPQQPAGDSGTPTQGSDQLFNGPQQ
ncbi:HtaA domain-containing protein [Leucobacter sp. GX24907]